MIQTLLSFLPGTATMTVLIIAIAGTLAGGALWLGGARFSRSLIALLMVTLGAGIGMKLPGIFHWPIDAWAPGVGAAIVMGILGFALHRVWVGVGFGIVLACWAALAVWMLRAGDAGWNWPASADAGAATAAGSILNIQWLKVLWQSLPTDVSRLLPLACGAAMVVGMLAAWRWPRLGLVLLHSSAGASLLVGMGVAAIHFGRPQWMDELGQFIPMQTGSQVSLLGALIAFGAILQWQTPGRAQKQNNWTAAGDRGGGKSAKRGAKSMKHAPAAMNE